MLEILSSLIAGLLVGGVGIFLIRKYQDENNKKSARVEADRILSRAKSEAVRIEKESKNKSKDFEARARKNVETEIQKQKSQMKNKENQLERRLKEVEDQFKKQLDEHERSVAALKDKEQKCEIAESRLKELDRKLNEQVAVLKQKLESVAHMSDQEAKRELISALEDEAKAEAAKIIAKIEEEAQEEAERRAKKIIAQAMARFAGDYTSERTVSVVALPSDEMKGKIIGREGRNIRTLESLCGVDLIIDDTPESVVVSSFDPIRREVGKRVLEKLIEDGRVHPARIEEVVDKVRVDLQKIIKEDGEKACLELGIPALHPEILKAIGSLKYRSTHMQNAYQQAIEVGYIAGLIAAEMSANVKLARRAGLLHNIGLAVDHQAEGGVSVVGSEFLKRHQEPEAIVQAIRQLHTVGGVERPYSLISLVVQTAYQLSVTRPGARRPSMDSFVQRMVDLESIGNGFEGVVRTFAVQAGREVRVIVEASKVTDDLAVMLSRDIARKIEREIPHAGQTKISVIRESRAVEHAR